MIFLGASQWSVVSTRGYPVRGGYGHSASWDPLTKRIYVYGGFVAENPSSSKLSKEIFAYEPYSRTWQVVYFTFMNFFDVFLNLILLV